MTTANTHGSGNGPIPNSSPNPHGAHPDWQGRTAIVTGAGQGIGFAICQQLIAYGASVVLNDSDPQLAKRAASSLGPNCLPIPGDAADIPFIRHMVDTTIRTFGRLDIVVANAGLTLFGDFFTYPPESFSRVMQLNLGGTFFLAQAAAQQMRDQGQGGSILFTSSVTGHQAHKDLAAYGMSKAALEMLARSLRHRPLPIWHHREYRSARCNHDRTYYR